MCIEINVLTTRITFFHLIQRVYRYIGAHLSWVGGYMGAEAQYSFKEVTGGQLYSKLTIMHYEYLHKGLHD